MDDGALSGKQTRTVKRNWSQFIAVLKRPASGIAILPQLVNVNVKRRACDLGDGIRGIVR